MRTKTLNALASATLGLMLVATAAPLLAAEPVELDFAGAKAKALADNKFVLVDFSAPT